VQYKKPLGNPGLGAQQSPSSRETIPEARIHLGSPGHSGDSWLPKSTLVTHMCRPHHAVAE
jgi:hypothetical protein